jgi:hypothetical protein
VLGSSYQWTPSALRCHPFSDSFLCLTGLLMRTSGLPIQMAELLPKPTYHREGVAFYAADAAGPGLVPVCRLYVAWKGIPIKF